MGLGYAGRDAGNTGAEVPGKAKGVDVGNQGADARGKTEAADEAADEAEATPVGTKGEAAEGLAAPRNGEKGLEKLAEAELAGAGAAPGETSPAERNEAVADVVGIAAAVG